MTTAIHIELNALCLLILCVITYQSVSNVNQQMHRVLFRSVVYGVIAQLILDSLWLLVEGRRFPGAILANRVLNGLFLSMSVILGCIWYLYVLETLGHTITRRLQRLMMLPGLAFTALNLLSIFTEWTFTVSPENVYAHGPLFWVQMIGAYGMLLVSLVHILIRLFDRDGRVPRRTVLKLLGFYVVPIIGAVVSLFYTGMPGAWTCAAISIVLIYLDDQDSEILRDGLTGLNNRKTLEAAFAEYVKQGRPLFLFMMDLDRFKQINDTLGHPVGDEALVAAASILTRSMVGRKGILARYGCDEFLAMLFLADEAEADAYRQSVKAAFEVYNREHALPYRLAASVGYVQHSAGMALEDFVNAADGELYKDKRAGR